MLLCPFRTAVGQVLEMKGLDAGLVVRRPDGLFYQQMVDVSGGETDENVSASSRCSVCPPRIGIEAPIDSICVDAVASLETDCIASIGWVFPSYSLFLRNASVAGHRQ